jgi:hypothetical protein
MRTIQVSLASCLSSFPKWFFFIEIQANSNPFKKVLRCDTCIAPTGLYLYSGGVYLQSGIIFLFCFVQHVYGMMGLPIHRTCTKYIYPLYDQKNPLKEGEASGEFRFHVDMLEEEEFVRSTDEGYEYRWCRSFQVPTDKKKPPSFVRVFVFLVHDRVVVFSLSLSGSLVCDPLGLCVHPNSVKRLHTTCRTEKEERTRDSFIAFVWMIELLNPIDRQLLKRETIQSRWYRNRRLNSLGSHHRSIQSVSACIGFDSCWHFWRPLVIGPIRLDKFWMKKSMAIIYRRYRKLILI